ncbi:radical SAM/Cys-rich domain protein [Thiohalobacter sp. COW1]|uniref:arsenosugar biosynthesis radical SAM (seleno)protein ArsS n=1 Tax=Thiohalobacter sp. COW1 TaxID=2795687 RepID=UPI001915432E|nr:arsenosugar biosynthesis radical SAM (seleno)protein ArsS [Thiohalobacter sp. COW1]BCO30903.1 radical SAM/Cys-rich domain protein [Thiohalobacter sp. COW1]
MHATLPLLRETDFPTIRRGPLQTLQANLGYKCNQSCLHCHVNAGPTRSEMMDGTTLQMVVAFLQASGVRQLDLTGGAPELHPRFRELVSVARALEVEVIDRCNLTILEEPGQEGLAEFLAEHRVGIIASLPCYLEENVESQRGKGVYAASIRGLQRLNALGYGQPDSGLELNLMYNPVGPWLPPPQAGLEADYRRELAEREGVVFNRLYALTNMPIARFGSTLISHDGFEDYMALLKSAHCPDNLNTVMCRSLISVDWQGYVYDCDFNQMLALALGDDRPTHLSELIGRDLDGRPIAVADHCYGCTAGQGSSCGGALGG